MALRGKLVTMAAVGLAFLAGFNVGHRDVPRVVNVSAARAYALKLYSANQCGAAIGTLSQVLRRDPTDVVVEGDLGACLVDIGDFGAAIEYLTPAARKDQAFLQDLADAYCISGQIVACEKTIVPGNPRLWSPANLLGLAADANNYGLFAQAAVIENDIRPVVRDYSWYVEASRTSLAAGNIRMGISRLDEAVRESPSGSRGHVRMLFAQALQGAGMYRKARSEAMIAIQSGQYLGIDRSSALADLASIDYQLGLYGQAFVEDQLASHAAPTVSELGSELEASARDLAAEGKLRAALDQYLAVSRNRRLNSGDRVSAASMVKELEAVGVGA